jgi:hypothetical protein
VTGFDWEDLKSKIETAVRDVVEFSTGFCLDNEDEREALIDAVTCEVGTALTGNGKGLAGLLRMVKEHQAYVYAGDCTTSDYDSISAMRDNAEPVGFYEFAMNVKGLDEWARRHDYEDSEADGLTLKKDWHVSYNRSFYKGKPCYFLVWSSVEHIWTHEGGFVGLVNLTCDGCAPRGWRGICRYSFDPYNTNGDCLAAK